MDQQLAWFHYSPAPFFVLNVSVFTSALEQSLPAVLPMRPAELFVWPERIAPLFVGGGASHVIGFDCPLLGWGSETSQSAGPQLDGQWWTSSLWPRSPCCGALTQGPDPAPPLLLFVCGLLRLVH